MAPFRNTTGLLTATLSLRYWEARYDATQWMYWQPCEDSYCEYCDSQTYTSNWQ
jgi:hypothetical protein